jgi:hypothetical protein
LKVGGKPPTPPSFFLFFLFFSFEGRACVLDQKEEEKRGGGALGRAGSRHTRTLDVRLDVDQGRKVKKTKRTKRRKRKRWQKTRR